MAIVAVMRQHEIGIRLGFEILENPLDVGALVRKETIAEIVDGHARRARATQKQRGAPPRFTFARRLR